MNSDELGALAQPAFDRLCASAKLLVNSSSDRDRTGWDYRLEFPSAQMDKIIELDKRKVPPPIMVQVKGVKTGSKIVKVNLKTLERFAKLSEPAVICILEFCDPDTICGIYYIHLLNAALETILKRLTKISVNGNELTGRETLSFSKQKYWKAFDATSKGILAILESGVLKGLTTEQYSTAKNLQLAKLGYGESPFTGKFTVVASNSDEFSDGMLGLRPLTLTKFNMFEERFGFKRESFSISETGGTIEISPRDPLEVLIHFQIGGLDTPIILNGNIITPAIPPASINEMRFLIKAEPLAFDIKPEGKFKVSAGGFDTLSLPCTEWVNIFTILDGISRPNFSFKLTSRDLKPYWSCNMSKVPEIPDGTKNGNRWLLNHWRYLQKILNKCGGEKLSFTLEEMDAASGQIRSCYSSLFTKKPEISIGLDGSGFESDSDIGKEVRGHFGNAFRVGKYCVAYVCKMTAAFSKNGEEYKLSGTLSSEGVAELVDESQYEKFLDRAIIAGANEIVFTLPIDKENLPIQIN